MGAESCVISMHVSYANSSWTSLEIKKSEALPKTAAY